MNGLVNRLGILENRFERLAFQEKQLEARVAALETRLRELQTAQGGGGQSGGGVVYSMAGVVIAAGGSVTGATVNALVGGATSTVSTNATVYNQMQAATVASKTIMLGLNPDGTFSAISQSC